MDLILESDEWLVFVEVKMDAEPSHGTRSDPERNQLIRNLDVGYRRALEEKKGFALIYMTPDTSQPGIVARIRSGACSFPANAEVDPTEVTGCLSWSSWGALGDALAYSYKGGKLDDVERKFALDLLAYLCGKRLWANTLGDDRLFYEDNLYRSLRKSDSPFVAYASGTVERYQAWRTKPWHQTELRAFLHGLRPEDKALLKLLADADGALQQRQIMDQLPFLKGRSSASLRSLKSHINAGCKQVDCAPILSEGSGSGDYRIHEINRSLGSELRAVVLDVAKQFEIHWHLLEKGTPNREGASNRNSEIRFRRLSASRGWFVIESGGRRMIAGLVDAKGSCSCRLYDVSTGHFLRKLPNAHGSFRTAFAHVITGAKEFRPPFQPVMETTEKLGLPTELLRTADPLSGS